MAGTWWYEVAWRVAGTQVEGQRLVGLSQPLASAAAVMEAQTDIARQAGESVDPDQVMILNVIYLAEDTVTGEDLARARARAAGEGEREKAAPEPAPDSLPVSE